MNNTRLSRNPACGNLMATAERELGAFLGAVTKLFGPEQANLSADDWLDELVLLDGSTGPTSRDWRRVTVAAAARLASRVSVALPSFSS